MARSELGRTGARFGAPKSRHAPDPEYPHGPPPGLEQEPDAPAPETGPPVDGPPGDDLPADGTEDSGEDLVGVTGARFGGHSAKRKRKSRKERAAERAAAEQAPEIVAPEPEPAQEHTWDTAPLPAVVDDPEPAPQRAFAPVRPYVITGGRTRVRMELRLETLVSVRPQHGPPRADSHETTTVLGLCAQTRSVSEVAALAAMPLGVARVLIDDLATEGRITVHGVSSAEDGPSMQLMDRVLAGLRRL